MSDRQESTRKRQNSSKRGRDAGGQGDQERDLAAGNNDCWSEDYLEELYDRKKRWDDKFGPGDDTAHSSKTVRPESTPRLSVAPSAGPSLPRPSLPIVDDVDDDEESDQEEVQDDQAETEDQERLRLVKLFIRPGHRTSLAANSMGVLRLMEDIHKAYPREFKQQLPVSATYADNIPILSHELRDRKIWDEMDTELARHERSVGYERCSKLYAGTQGVHSYTGEDRVIQWSWWWDQLWRESINSPDYRIWKRLWETEKEKLAKLPRAVRYPR